MFMCLYPKVMQIKRKGKNYCEPVQVACGKCVECLTKKATEWSFRLMDEAKLHKYNCFMTLTYSPENYPVGGNVNCRDIQLFMKRLRKKLKGVKIRYFYCGEYGKKRGRPHYHLILFGYCPDDIRFNFVKAGIKHYRSALIEQIWKLGNVDIEIELNLDNTKYCAKYMQKLNVSENSQGSAEPFIRMSNRPGIGAGSFDEKSLVCDKIYHNGKSINVPRYYLKLAERNGWNLEEFHDRRLEVGQFYNRDDNLKQRRAIAQEFKIKKFVKRS